MQLSLYKSEETKHKGLLCGYVHSNRYCRNFIASARARVQGSTGKNGSNQSFDFIKDFKSSVKSLCD